MDFIAMMKADKAKSESEHKVRMEKHNKQDAKDREEILAVAEKVGAVVESDGSYSYRFTYKEMVVSVCNQTTRLVGSVHRFLDSGDDAEVFGWAEKKYGFESRSGSSEAREFCRLYKYYHVCNDGKPGHVLASLFNMIDRKYWESL